MEACQVPGWIQGDDAPGGLLIAEIRTKVGSGPMRGIVLY